MGFLADLGGRLSEIIAASIYTVNYSHQFILPRKDAQGTLGKRMGIEVNFPNVFADSCADCEDDADNDGSSFAFTKTAKHSRKHT